MIWLRHELWDYPDGLSYRLASKAETAAAHPEGRLSQVFYAPSPAAAEAQYCALRGMGPYIVNSADSEAPFTMAQLESQLADFPDDHRLSRQPDLPVPEGGHPPIQVAHPEPLHAAAEAPGGDGGEGDHEAEDHVLAEAHAETPHEDEQAHEPEQARRHDDLMAEPEPAPGLEPSPEPDQAAPVSITPAHETSADATPDIPADGLGPLSLVETGLPRRTARRRRRNPIVGVLKLIWLLIVIGAVIVGVGLATGALNGPTLLAQARDLGVQLRAPSFWRALIPDVGTR